MRMWAAAMVMFAGPAFASCQAPVLKQELMVGLLMCKAAGAYDGLRGADYRALQALTAVSYGGRNSAISRDGMVFCARAAAQFLAAQNRQTACTDIKTAQLMR